MYKLINIYEGDATEVMMNEAELITHESLPICKMVTDNDDIALLTAWNKFYCVAIANGETPAKFTVEFIDESTIEVTVVGEESNFTYTLKVMF